MVREERVRIELDDKIWGINGTYVKDDKVDGVDNEEDLYYIYYHPAKDAHKSLKDYVLTLIGKPPLYKTPEPIPKSQFRRVTCPYAGEVPGVPPQKMVLMATKNGDAYWDNHLASAVSRDLKQESEAKERERAKSQLERVRRMKEERRSSTESDTSNTGSASRLR
jgi:hypothetical protein